jgi:pimeloyl-ACP methyl ester carboxylesterase
LWLGVLGACEARPDPGAPATPTLPLAPCFVRGAARPAECATLVVPERWEAPGGARLELRVAVLRAPERGDPAPLVLLAGGPGQAATEAFAEILPALGDAARRRDVVLVDQRGSGAGALGCPDPEGWSDELRAGALARRARGCAEALRGRDLGAYGTAPAVADLEEARRALGYERLHLCGVSYGTRLALAYAQRHPERVATLVLDGVLSPGRAVPLGFAADAERALDLALDGCAADPGCAAAFGDVRGRLAALLAPLDRAPLSASVPHPRTGTVEELLLGRDAVAQLVRALLYLPELRALLPFAVARAAGGDPAPLVAQAAVVAEAARAGTSLPLFLSVICAEDLPRIGPELEATEAAAPLLGDTVLRELRAACAEWPVAPAAAPDATTAVLAPSLIFSGELDPVTPPRWAEQALALLPHAHALTVRGAAHGTIGRACAGGLVARFLEAREGSRLDTPCLGDPPPPFFVDAAGPAH